MKYLSRILDKLLADKLKTSGAVQITGPKWCGKTSTAKEQAKSSLLMQDVDQAQSNLKIAGTKPSLLLSGDTPRLLDEWQVAPVLWDAVRFAVDQRNENGQFILTGSTVPPEDETMHSGTGRIVSMLMRPMSLFESGDSNGDVSLQNLFDSVNYESLSAVSTLEVEAIAKVTARGGWPRAVTSSSLRVALEQAYNYVEAIINVDMRRLDGIKRDPAKVRAVLKSVARNISTPASLATIQTDIAQSEESLSSTTATEYLDALKRLFVVEDLEAWNPAMRSKTPLRSTAKRHFVDPSIACAAIRATPERLLSDFNTFGYLFESLCVRDLRVYAESIGGKVFYYRDKNDLEADAVVSLNDGRWAPVEIKLGESEVDEASKHLLRLKDKVDTKKMGEPAFCLILTGTQYAYQRKDGTLVVPIGTLAP